MIGTNESTRPRYSEDKAWLSISLPEFKKYILPTLKEKCVSDVVRISTIIFHLSKLWKDLRHTVWCYIAGEAAGEIWSWWLLEVKGLRIEWHVVCGNLQMFSQIEGDGVDGRRVPSRRVSVACRCCGSTSRRRTPWARPKSADRATWRASWPAAPPPTPSGRPTRSTTTTGPADSGK